MLVNRYVCVHSTNNTTGAVVGVARQTSALAPPTTVLTMKIHPLSNRCNVQGNQNV